LLDILANTDQLFQLTETRQLRQKRRAVYRVSRVLVLDLRDQQLQERVLIA
jgi:hypothetical protein